MYFVLRFHAHQLKMQEVAIQIRRGKSLVACSTSLLTKPWKHEMKGLPSEVARGDWPQPHKINSHYSHAHLKVVRISSGNFTPQTRSLILRCPRRHQTMNGLAEGRVRARGIVRLDKACLRGPRCDSIIFIPKSVLEPQVMFDVWDVCKLVVPWY